jgi:hypothetical protein
MGVARVTFVGLDSLRNTDPIMDLLTLYHLRDHLAEEKFRLELSTLMENDPAHQRRLEQWTHRINVLLAEVRGEVAAGEVPGARSSVTTQEFETYVHDVLKAYNALDVIHAAEAQRTA